MTQYRIIRLCTLAAGFAMANLALATGASAQVDENDRYQRCVNNIAQVSAIDASIAETRMWNAEQIARGRLALEGMQASFESIEGSRDPNSPLYEIFDEDAELAIIKNRAAAMGLSCNVDDSSCAGLLVNGMREIIEQSTLYLPWREAKERDRATYANNIVALSCADFAPGGRYVDPQTGLLAVPGTAPVSQVAMPPSLNPAIAPQPGPGVPVVGMSSRGCTGFAGTWDMGEWGVMRLYGETGAYSLRDGQGQDNWMGDTFSVSGVINGMTWEGQYFQPSFPDPRWQQGRVTWLLSADGNSVTGNSWDAAGTTSTDWNGVCVGPA